MPKANVNGINLYYEVHGKGDPIVLILGFTMNHLGWGPIVQMLAEHFQVIIFDNRGAGLSDAPDEPYSVELMAKDTVALLDSLNIQKAHFLGQSMGSCISQLIGILYPDRVNKLVLCGTFTKLRPVAIFAHEELDRLFKEGLDPRRVIEIMVPFVFGDNFLKDPAKEKMLLELIRKDPYPMPYIGFKRQKEALQEFNSMQKLGNIRAETLVVGYEKDICTTLEEAKLVHEKIAHSKMVVMEKAGHGGLQEDPVSFTKSVLDFLKK